MDMHMDNDADTRRGCVWPNSHRGHVSTASGDIDIDI